MQNRRHAAAATAPDGAPEKSLFNIGKETQVNMNLLVLVGFAWFAVGQLREHWDDRKSIDDTIKQERIETDRRFADMRADTEQRFAKITTALATISSTMKQLSSDFDQRTRDLQQRTPDRWSTGDQATHCLQTALANPGFQCVNPWFTVNTRDADVSDIPTWSVGNGSDKAPTKRWSKPPDK